LATLSQNIIKFPGQNWTTVYIRSNRHVGHMCMEYLMPNADIPAKPRDSNTDDNDADY